MPKVSKVNQKGYFQYKDVMETIEDLVLTERTFLGESKLHIFDDVDPDFFQRDYHLYIYPPFVGEIQKQFGHVNFEEQPEALVNGDKVLVLGWKQNIFIKLPLHKVHQQIFMEHIPYAVCEIFVIDPEVIKKHTWLEKQILYSYLPEMGKIFTPLTEDLAGYVVEKSDDLSLANLEVVFLTKSNVKILRDERDMLGYDVYLTGAFNYLEGGDFNFHKLSEFETWGCFKTSKGEIKKFNESQTGAKEEYLPGSNGDNVIKMNHHKVNNHKHGSPDTDNHLIPLGDNSKESGSGAKTGGAKLWLLKKINSNKSGSNGDNVTKTNHHAEEDTDAISDYNVGMASTPPDPQATEETASLSRGEGMNREDGGGRRSIREEEGTDEMTKRRGIGRVEGMTDGRLNSNVLWLEPVSGGADQAEIGS
eukprot:jgi/Psemu1/6134/gm1.6134_g